MTGRPAAVLFVCTGNVCRSPLMERLLTAQRAGPQASPGGHQLTVASAGTGALVGSPMTDRAVAELVRLGVEPTAHLARQVTAELVSGADLVVTATRSHRAAVVTLVPRATRYTFTALELARLLTDTDTLSLPADPSLRVRELAAVAASGRGLAPPPVTAYADDIPDPYGRPDADYRRATDLMAPAVAVLAAALS